MNDAQLYHGRYKAITCEWISDNTKCRRPTLAGKSYCDDHYHRVFITMTDEEVDALVDAELHTLDITAKLENK